MNCEEVMQDLKAEGVQNAKCVTQHRGFNPVCLQKWSLKMAAYRYKTKDKSKYSQTSTQNRLDNLFNYVVKFFFVAKVFPLDLFIN
jgi:hypothetical protein